MSPKREDEMAGRANEGGLPSVLRQLLDELDAVVDSVPDSQIESALSKTVEKAQAVGPLPGAGEYAAMNSQLTEADDAEVNEASSQDAEQRAMAMAGSRAKGRRVPDVGRIAHLRPKELPGDREVSPLRRWLVEDVVDVAIEEDKSSDGALAVVLRMPTYVARHLAAVLDDWSTIGRLLESARGGDERDLAGVLYDAARAADELGERAEVRQLRADGSSAS